MLNPSAYADGTDFVDADGAATSQTDQQLPALVIPAPGRLFASQMNSAQPLIDAVADHKVLLGGQHSFAVIGDFKRREQDLSGIHRGAATVVLLHKWLRRQRQPAHRRI